MLNKKTLAVIKRELREKLFSRSFILMTLLIPIFLFGILALQTFLISYSGEGKITLQVISERQDVTEKVQTEFLQEKIVKDKSYSIEFRTMEKNRLSGYLDEVRSNIVNEKLTGIIYIPASSLKDKKVEYYSKTPNNQQVLNKLKPVVNKALSYIYFSQKGFTASDVT